LVSTLKNLNPKSSSQVEKGRNEQKYAPGKNGISRAQMRPSQKPMIWGKQKYLKMVQSSTKPMIWGMDAPFLNKPDPIFFAMIGSIPKATPIPSHVKT
jgi:hypothetical protein